MSLHKVECGQNFGRACDCVDLAALTKLLDAPIGQLEEGETSEYEINDGVAIIETVHVDGTRSVAMMMPESVFNEIRGTKAK